MASEIERWCKYHKRAHPIEEFIREIKVKKKCSNSEVEIYHEKGDTCNCFSMCNDANELSVYSARKNKKQNLEHPKDLIEMKQWCSGHKRYEPIESFRRRAARNCNTGKCSHKIHEICACFATCNAYFQNGTLYNDKKYAEYRQIRSEIKKEKADKIELHKKQKKKSAEFVKALNSNKRQKKS